MRREMESLAKQVCDNFEGIVYFTENPININDKEGKYFLCFHNTHKIKFAWETQTQAIEELKDILKNGFSDGNMYFTIEKQL